MHEARTFVAGESGLAAILNRIVNRCLEDMAPAEGGGLTNVDTIPPSEILEIMEMGARQ